MFVLIDGEKRYVGNDVKIIWETDEDIGQEFHLTVTHEGMIHDVIEPDGVVATESSTADEYAEYMVNEQCN